MKSGTGNVLTGLLRLTEPGNTAANRGSLLWMLGLCLIGILAVGIAYGPVFTPDGWRDQYLADALVAANFDLALYTDNVRGWMDEHNWRQSPLPYLLFHTLLAAIRGALDADWHWGLIVCNALAHVATLAITARLYVRAGGAIAGALLICLAGAVCWEFVQWVPQTQVDSTFVLMVTGVFVLLAHALLHGARWLWAAALMLIVANLWKPTAMVAVVALAIVLPLALVMQERDRESAAWIMRRVTLIGLVTLAFLLPFLVYPLYDPTVLPDGVIENSFWGYHDFAARGDIVWERPEYRLSSMDGYGDYLVLVAARLIMFFGFTSELFSPAHNAINIVFFVPFYLLVAAGTWFVFAADRLSPTLRILGCFSVGWIALYDGFHAVTLLDFDWRYRTVVYPALFILMACGLDVLFPRVANVLQRQRTP